MWKRVYIESIVAHASKGLVGKDGRSRSDSGWQNPFFLWEIPMLLSLSRREGSEPEGFPTHTDVRSLN